MSANNWFLFHIYINLIKKKGEDLKDRDFILTHWGRDKMDAIS